MKYRRDDERNAYICDNLEEFLLEKGVSKEQINKAKSNIMKPNLLEFAIRESEEKPSEKLVPTEKIVGTLRSTPGKSVFENVSVIYDGDRDEARFMNDLNKLNYWSLEEYKESFIHKIEPVDMVYYEDEDEYFMKGDGNHRTLTALLVGAEYIKAKVTKAKIDYKKLSRHQKVERFYEEMGIEKITASYRGYEIYFCDQKGIYSVDGYDQCEKGKVDYFIEKTQKEIETDIRIASKINKLPKLIQKVILSSDKLERVRKHVNRAYNQIDYMRYNDYLTCVDLEKLYDEK